MKAKYNRNFEFQKNLSELRVKKREYQKQNNSNLINFHVSVAGPSQGGDHKFIGILIRQYSIASGICLISQLMDPASEEVVQIDPTTMKK
jgi:hypothetical protein